MHSKSLAIIAASLLAIGTAHAAPSFGTSSNRVGGGTTYETGNDSGVFATIQSLLSLINFDLSAKTEPVEGRKMVDDQTPAAECEKAKDETAEVAQVEPEAGGEKLKNPPLEPMFLAF